MANALLDASALLALLNAEPGAAAVARTLPRAIISSVNLAEVVTKLSDHGMPEDALRPALDRLGLRVVAFDEQQAYRAGTLREATRHLGLSLGDRSCLALGESSGLPVLTTDARWAELELELEIQVIRPGVAGDAG